METFIHDPNFSTLINAYRASLVRRYSSENVSHFLEFETLDRKIIDSLVKYFLDLLYPEYEVRLRLDNAFHSLAGFVKSPKKFLGVIGNMGYAVIKFGKHLIGGIRAGSAALSSYLTAHKFENNLFKHAKPLIESGANLFDDKVFNSLIAKISYKEATDFRNDIVNLFKTLANRELLNKIIDINEHIIEKMKQRKDIYSQIEIEGIEMGLNILKKGREVFTSLSDETIQIVIRGIDTIEKDFFDKAYLENNTDGRT
jgi:hypothetical protein